MARLGHSIDDYLLMAVLVAVLMNAFLSSHLGHLGSQNESQSETT